MTGSSPATVVASSMNCSKQGKGGLCTSPKSAAVRSASASTNMTPCASQSTTSFLPASSRMRPASG